jgi:hypothetical protein
LPVNENLHLKNLRRLGYSPQAMSTVPKSVQKYLSELGRKGGSVKSKRKAAAVRENGKKGGRPKSKKKSNGKANGG